MEWRPVVGFESCYEVSDAGLIRRIGKGRGVTSGRVLRFRMQNAGYLMVHLSQGNQSAGRLVHRVVAEAFLGPIPDGKEVNHRDACKTHNEATNLEYMTRRENLFHAAEHGLGSAGELNGQAKLTERNVREIRARYRYGGNPGYKALALEYGVSWEAIRNIIKGRVWQHVLQ